MNTVTINETTYPLAHDNKGYPMILHDHKPYRLHRLLWQLEHGELDEGMVLHHIGQNKENWSLDNLQVMPRVEHTSCIMSYERCIKL